MMDLRKFILPFFIPILFYFFSLGVLFAQDSNAIWYLMKIKGECHNSVFESQKKECKDMMFHSEYENGRIGFMYLLVTDEEHAVLYSGNGPQEAPSENRRIEPIDVLFVSGIRIEGSGKCMFENPYLEIQARLECDFKSLNGVIFSNHFLTDAEKPEFIIEPKLN